MPWYLISFSRAEMESGKGDELERSAQTIWDSSGNPTDFALDNPLTVYYLSPEGHKYCTDGNLMKLRPRVLHEHEKPLREGLRVIVGDPRALQLLD